jgi:hypothetical protein
VPDTEVTDDDGKINCKACFACEEAFLKDDKEVYGCDNCPRWFHHRYMPPYVFEEAEEEDIAVDEVLFVCVYCR